MPSVSAMPKSLLTLLGLPSELKHMIFRLLCPEDHFSLWHGFETKRREIQDVIVADIERDPGDNESGDGDLGSNNVRGHDSGDDIRNDNSETHESDEDGENEFDDYDEEPGEYKITEYTLRLSAEYKDEVNYTHTPPPSNILPLLLTNRQMKDEFGSWFLTESTFVLACYPTEIMSGALIPMASIERMQRIKLRGPALNIAGGYSMEDTSNMNLGIFDCSWQTESKKQNDCWQSLFDIMENRMYLKLVGIEFEVNHHNWGQENEIEPGRYFL